MRRRPAVTLALVTTLVLPAAGWSTSLLAAPAPAAAAAETVEFTAVGDFGSGASARATFAGLGARAADLTMALGDLSYSTTMPEEQWCGLVHDGVGEGYPFELVSGNHESNGQNGFIDAYATCLPNQLPGLRGTYGRQWWVDHPASQPVVRFVAVSPGIPFPEGNLDYSAGSARYRWTADAIDGARAAGVPWVVVAMHVPCLSVGTYSCTGVEDLTNLLVQKKVDLVLSGHEHLYQRTHQVSTGAGCSALTPGVFTAACVVDSDGAFGKGRGTVFATVGTGGVESRAATLTDPEMPYFAAVSAQNRDPAFGFLSVRASADRLDASFVRSGTGSFTDTFSIDAASPAPNEPPVAAATAVCTGLSCRFDGTASRDPDGTVSDYAWDFGDGTTGAGATPTHLYAAAGTYRAELTVTDDDGARASATHTVVLTAPPTTSVLAADAFGRTVASGWGSADTGGAWSDSIGTGSSASVDGSAGLMRIAAGRTVAMTLPPLGTRSLLTARFSVDKVPTGSGLYLSTMVRNVAGQGDYRAKMRYLSNGNLGLSLSRVSATGAETSLASEIAVPGVSVAAGDTVALRLSAVGTSPTTLQVRAWKVGTAEPTTWQRTATDSTAGLQASGGVGFSVYLSGSASNAPVTLSVDDFEVTPVP